MKCEVCKFDDEVEQKVEEWETKAEFVEIHGNFTAYLWRELKPVSIYACPKCGTLKTDALR